MSAGSVAARGWVDAVENILWLVCADALRLVFDTAALREKRRRAGAVQDAGALFRDLRIARSVLECASPLALWVKMMQPRCG